MKYIYPIGFFLLTILSVCKLENEKNGKSVEKKEEVLDTKDSPQNFAPKNTSTAFVLKNRTQNDTLFVHFHPFNWDENYSLVWQKDTIAKIFSYAKPTDFIKRLDTLNWHNIFLLSDEGGDGCPTVLRFLTFYASGKSYLLSEPFGNCQEIETITYQYPFISFYFSEYGAPNEYPYRKKAKYVYHAERFTFKKVNR